MTQCDRMSTHGTYRALALIASVVLCACSKAPGNSAEKIPRESDAPPVVYVDSPDPTKVEFSSESEPNNELTQAAVLALGTGVRGTLDGEVDKDVYKVEVEKPGALKVHLSGIDKVDLVLELLDASGEVLAASDRGPAMTTEGIANFAVVEGNYHLRVSEFVKKRKTRKTSKKRKKTAEEPDPEGRTGLSPVYQLVVEFGAQDQPLFEREDNGTPETATEILLGDEVSGFIGWSRDVDVWKLSTEGFTPQYGVNIELSGIEGVTLELQILDETGQLLLKRDGSKGDGLAVRNLVVVRESETTPGIDPDGQGDRPAAAAESDKPGFYYARLKARRSNPEEQYRLRMSTRLMEPDEELEPNDTPAQATRLPILDLGTNGVTRAHLTWGDTDCFTIPAHDAPAVLSVSAVPNGEIDVELSVVANGQTLASSNANGRADKEVLDGLRIEAGREAVITVSGKGTMPSDARYDLTWSLEPAVGVPLGRDDLGGDDNDNNGEADRLLGDDYGDE